MDIKMMEDVQTVLLGMIAKTPIVKVDKIHKNLWIKVENLQATGAFTLRGYSPIGY